MGVKVITSELRNSSYVVKEHATGKGVFVKEGHLFVSSERNEAAMPFIVASYAPTSWRSAEVVQDQTAQ